MSDDASVWDPRDPVATIDNYSSILKERFVATGSQVNFVLTGFAYRVGVNSLQVTKNGVYLETGVDYTELNESTIVLIVPAAQDDAIVVVGYVGTVGAVSALSNLGSQAVEPAVDTLGTTLAAAHEGYFYWNSASKNHWTWNGTIWVLTTATAASTAALTSIADSASIVVGTNVETAIQEIMGNARDEKLIWGGTSTGSANAQLIAPASPCLALVKGQKFSFQAGFTNTNATVTMTVSGLGGVLIQNYVGSTINVGDIIAGEFYTIMWDGALFRLISNVNSRIYVPEDPIVLSTTVVTGAWTTLAATNASLGGAKAAFIRTNVTHFENNATTFDAFMYLRRTGSGAGNNESSRIGGQIQVHVAQNMSFYTSGAGWVKLNSLGQFDFYINWANSPAAALDSLSINLEAIKY